MKQGKYAAPVRRRRRRNTLKPMLIAMAVVLLLGCVTGGTLAWLTSTTGPVTNTFTVGDINITLDETTSDYKMIPGYTITKDPKVTVKAGSEACYLFVKIDESATLDDYIAYAVDTDWTKMDQVPGVDNVWYIEITSNTTADTYYPILAAGSITESNVTYSWTDNQVLVKPTVTKGMMDNLNKADAVQPTLTFQAAAVQYNKNNTTEFTVADAYALAFTTTP